MNALVRRLPILIVVFVGLVGAVVATVLLNSDLTEQRTAARPTLAPAPPRSNQFRTFLSAEQRKDAFNGGGFISTPFSLLRVDRAMHYGDWKWNDDGVPPGPTTIRVDLRTQLLSVFRGGHEIGTAVVLYGADEKETPEGRFPILWKGRNHRSSLYDAPMPFTLRLTGDGVAIHGSDVRWGAATHGCVGVPTQFANHLFEVAKVGDPVLILRSEQLPKLATSR